MAEQYELISLSEELELRRHRKGALDSLAEFARRAWPIVEPNNPYQSGWHIDAICEHLEACFRREIRNLIINVPPRHMKSSLICVLFPAWVWAQSPHEKFLFATYAASLSVRDAVKTRNLIMSEWYRNEFGIKWSLSDDQNTKVRYNNTASGYRISTSVGGLGTGEGSDFQVADDPHNATDVSSDIKRQFVLDWWDQQMSSRSNNPKTFVKIVVMQRLHQADLAGHLLSKGDWTHLCLPAEYEEVNRPHVWKGWTDPRKETGELLWPERFGPKEIATLKKDLGSQGWAGQGQQRPAPAEGNIVKRHWWRFYQTRPTEFDMMCQSWDLTFLKTAKGSFVVGQVWGRLGADKYLLDQFRGRIGFTDQLKEVIRMRVKWPEAHSIFVEKAANGEALLDMLRSKISGLLAVSPRGSKIVRAEAVAPQIESGNVYLPSPETCAIDPDTNEPWVMGFIEEWATIPNALDWDQVDASSQALTQLTSTETPDMEIVSVKGESYWNL